MPFSLLKSLIFGVILTSSFLINSASLISSHDLNLRLKIEGLKNCGLDIQSPSIYPFPIGEFYKQLENLVTNNQDCNFYIQELKNHIELTFIKPLNKIGVQIGEPEYYFQGIGPNFFEKENIYFSNEYHFGQWAYNFKATKTEDKTNFDESFISFHTRNNRVLTIGKVPKFWSPSWETSLIISNQSRPRKGISISNNLRNNITIPFLNILREYDFQFVLDDLGKKREVPKAKLIGFNIRFYPSSEFNFSVFRTAQFGGKGRPEGLSTIKNLILGRDNVGSSGITRENQPGNQLAGLDFNFRLLKKKNLELFAQVVGEDESGYLPSRTFFHVGLGYNFLQLGPGNKFLVEYLDTGHRSIENYTYNHFIYKTGYRFEGQPIGASIDADSDRLSFSFYKLLEGSGYFKVTTFKSNINRNNDSRNSWSNNRVDLSGFEFSVRYPLNSNLTIELLSSYLKKNDSFVSNTNFDSMLIFEYSF